MTCPVRELAYAGQPEVHPRTDQYRAHAANPTGNERLNLLSSRSLRRLGALHSMSVVFQA